MEEAWGWLSFWKFVFIVASLLFYGTVTVVALKGAGDLVQMIRDMIGHRGLNHGESNG
ncbi:MAG: hypothetical protein VX733_09640 [Candidatus Latescibacterota bacterium]|nr:hypothetical protein [Candidatus Latescibacterota bacterium]